MPRPGQPSRTTAAAALLFAAVLAASGCAAYPYGSRPGGPPVPSHHGARRFTNPGAHEGMGAWAAISWKLRLIPREPPTFPPGVVPAYVPSVVSPDRDAIRRPDPGALQITWIGHSTFLLQVAGLDVLTDPIWSRRASPVPFLGPRRRAAPALAFADLPSIEAVLVSHSHYDHLDARTVRRLGDRPRWFVPLGIARWLAGKGITRVSELDWDQTSWIGPVVVHAVPARHTSMRSPFDFDRRLWAGWVLETPAGRVYFAGDTGPGPHFAEIARRYGPFRVAFLPIGGYKPRKLLRARHVDPREAVAAARALGADLAIAMHWGTFPLADDPMAEPPIYLARALRDQGYPADRFVVPEIGRTILLPARAGAPPAR